MLNGSSPVGHLICISYRLSPSIDRGQANDHFAPLFQRNPRTHEGTTIEADWDGNGNIIPNGNRTFKRQAKFDGHAKKHQFDSKTFRYIAPGRAFSIYRKDKMRDHARRRHAGAAIVAQAPHAAPDFHISDAEEKFEKEFGDSDLAVSGQSLIQQQQ